MSAEQVVVEVPTERIARRVVDTVTAILARQRAEIVAPKLAMTPAETAESLSLSRSTVYELIAAGRLPVVRVGRRLVVPVNALNDWLAAHARCSEVPGSGPVRTAAGPEPGDGRGGGSSATAPEPHAGEVVGCADDRLVPPDGDDPTPPTATAAATGEGR